MSNIHEYGDLDRSALGHSAALERSVSTGSQPISAQLDEIEKMAHGLREAVGRAAEMMFGAVPSALLNGEAKHPEMSVAARLNEIARVLRICQGDAQRFSQLG